MSQNISHFGTPVFRVDTSLVTYTRNVMKKELAMATSYLPFSNITFDYLSILYNFHIIGNHAPKFGNHTSDRIGPKMSRIWIWWKEISLKSNVRGHRSYLKNITHVLIDRLFFALLSSMPSDHTSLSWLSIMDNSSNDLTSFLYRSQFCTQ